MMDNGLIIPGEMHISGTIDDRGHFEKGKWVTIFTPLMEYLNAKSDESTFDLNLKVEIPLFKQGACVGYDTKDVFLGTYTQSELRDMITMTENLY